MFTLASVADPRLLDPRVRDDNTYITTMGTQQTSVHVELPNATGQTGTTEPGDLFHLRQVAQSLVVPVVVLYQPSQ